MTDPAPPAPPTAPAPQLLGVIESDRFCEECGFNLRGLHAFRDGATNLILVRCSECGTLHPASHLTSNARGAWFRRIAGAILFFWVVFLLWLTFIVGVTETGVQFATIGELGLDRSGTIVADAVRDHAGFVFFIYSVSLLVPFIQVTLFTVAAHHWKRWGYVIVAVLFPLAPAAILHQVMKDDYPRFYDITLPFRVAHTALQIGGGVAAAFLGRPFARLLVTLLIPPRPRQALAFLWLADAKPPPKLGKK